MSYIPPDHIIAILDELPPAQASLLLAELERHTADAPQHRERAAAAMLAAAKDLHQRVVGGEPVTVEDVRDIIQVCAVIVEVEKRGVQVGSGKQ